MFLGERWDHQTGVLDEWGNGLAGRWPWFCSVLFCLHKLGVYLNQ